MSFLDILRRKKREPDALAPEPERNFYPQSAGGVQNQPIYKEWDDEKAIREGLKASTYVYKAIDLKAKGFAKARLDLYTYNEQDEQIRIDNHPIYKLWDRPNPFMSGGEFRERLIQYLDLSGNAPIYKVRGVGNKVVALYPIPPANLQPIADSNRYITGYLYTNGSSRLQIDVDDVIHLQHPDPSTALWGLAPLKVVARTVDTDIDAVKWNKSSMQNRGVPDGVMSTDIALTDAQYNQAIDKWAEQQENASRAHKTLFLSGNWKYDSMANTAVEMDFINSRKMTREEITAAFGVPLILLGIMDNATYSNYQEARLSFWEDTEIPLIDRLMDSFTFGLAHEFGEDIIMSADYSEVPALKARLSAQAETARKFMELGYTRDEVNERLGIGFQATSTGDIRYITSSLIPEDLAGGDFGDDGGGEDPDSIMSDLDAIIDQAEAIGKANDDMQVK